MPNSGLDEISFRAHAQSLQLSKQVFIGRVCAIQHYQVHTIDEDVTDRSRSNITVCIHVTVGPVDSLHACYPHLVLYTH